MLHTFSSLAQGFYQPRHAAQENVFLVKATVKLSILYQSNLERSGFAIDIFFGYTVLHLRKKRLVFVILLKFLIT